MEFHIQDVILVVLVSLSHVAQGRKAKNAPEGVSVAVGLALILGLLYWCGTFDAPCSHLQPAAQVEGE